VNGGFGQEDVLEDSALFIFPVVGASSIPDMMSDRWYVARRHYTAVAAESIQYTSLRYLPKSTTLPQEKKVSPA